ncbi:3-hydroxyacyl-CoA dehydrogenase NAD-binding domain-containing protein [Burkholderia sp. Ac-20365]|uniref:3-hydroxyacyl-CoA dehydrogenase NAD-binding domain-containing protein n=1 Tax=Burkholderia sp. Ac-20365 TaxID=2703897 RepID=UPI00197C7C54|nr:3-hydroxyacyl-CoA dehydrogenase NAD-binding domain-containing protein [Burkholderia sp. Ac-20365]MBN3763494.1 NAD-binding protein [Burkholderia sp. Ac-20365]
MHSTQTSPVNPVGKSIAVVGGGTMGADIAASFVACGWHAHIVNPRDGMLESMPQRLQSALEKLDRPFEPERFIHHEVLQTVPWQEIDLVIEAAPEQLGIKQEIFAELERLARPDTPLCSNSSAIPISKIGEGLSTRARMLGTHYFMPAHLVPAVEVVCSTHTDISVADRVADFLKSVDKVPVRVKLDIPGFLANRIQHALSREAIKLVERGIATPEDVDNAVRYGFGFRYIAAGPLLQRDHAGLDIHCAAGATIYPDLCNDDVPSRYMSELVENGSVGMKAKDGFYQWTPERVQAEKARYEKALQGARAILAQEQERDPLEVNVPPSFQRNQ